MCVIAFSDKCIFKIDTVRCNLSPCAARLDDTYEKNKLLEPGRKHTQPIQYSCYTIQLKMYYTGE